MRSCLRSNAAGDGKGPSPHDYDHFLALLKRHLRPDVSLFACSGSEQWAQDTINALRAKGIAAGYEALPGGFTELVASTELDGILTDC